MTIRAAQVVHRGRDFLIRRIQNVAPTLNIPSETIKELGNENNVEVIRDIGDVSVDLESLAVTTDIEALITRVDPTATVNGQEFDLKGLKPFDMISPYRAKGAVLSSKGVILPYVYLESAVYRWGVGTNSTQRFTFRGDGAFYTPNTPYYQRVDPAGGVGPFAFTHAPATVLHEAGDAIFALCITAFFANGDVVRLSHGDDYTDTAAGFTLTTALAAGTILEVAYSAAAAEDETAANSNDLATQPGAVRGKDIDVYVSDGAATPTLIRWRGLQSAELTWRIAPEITNELGNQHTVDRDYDTPEVSGTLTMRPSSLDYLFARIAQVTGTPTNEVASMMADLELEVLIGINHPDTGARLKTFIVEDARFNPPAIPGQVGQRVEVPFPFASDTGSLRIIKGAP